MLRGLFAKRWTATQTKVTTQLSRLPNSTIWGVYLKHSKTMAMGVHFSLIAETQHRHSHGKPMKTYENIISSWIRRRSVRCSASWKPARAPTYRPSRGCRRKWRPRNEGIERGTGPGMMESERLKHAKTCKNMQKHAKTTDSDSWKVI